MSDYYKDKIIIAFFAQTCISQDPQYLLFLLEIQEEHLIKQQK